MTDAAERWLRENDPDYDRERAAWPHLKDGSYERPWQELLWDDPDREPEGALEPPTRLCERMRCGRAFVPTTSWNRYCSLKCQNAEKNRRFRARKRDCITTQGVPPLVRLWRQVERRRKARRVEGGV